MPRRKRDDLDLDAITDIPGIRVGHWSNRRAATGCTVVLAPFPHGAIGGVDVRGGAPGTRETELMRPGTVAERANAVLLTGGSAFGLDAAAGVMRYLEEQGVGFKFGKSYIPLVAGAVVFDLGIGSDKVRPDADAGYRAALAARKGIEQGSVGVGTGCTLAKARGIERALKGGVGTACERGPGGVLVGAIVAVNCGGEVLDTERGRVIAGPRSDKPGKFLDTLDLMRAERGEEPSIGENTTIAVVATNAVLTKPQANRLATVAQDGIARAIRPAHTLSDGDTVFALATCEVEADRRAHFALEALAPRAVERAIVRAVLSATGLAGVPSAMEWAAGTG